ncbi:hypothetical protein DFH11DRAFT_1541249 [Phellopilus nigrolimitatus]|nr:hypothetical protein DFH11DRAFT_1541249 [Phellopilus nigrolimitatus]
MTENQSEMVKNTWFAPLTLPQIPQPGGLGLYQFTGLLTPPPTPPPTPPQSPQLTGLGFFDEALSFAPVSPQAGGLGLFEASVPTFPQLWELELGSPTQDNVEDHQPIEAAASLAPEAVSFEADLIAAPPSACAVQLTVYRAKAMLELPDVSLDVPAPDASSVTAAVAAPTSAYANQLPIFRQETMLPLPYLSPEERGPETHLAQGGLTYQPLILLAGEEGVEKYYDPDGDLLDGPGDMYHWV